MAVTFPGFRAGLLDSPPVPKNRLRRVLLVLVAISAQLTTGWWTVAAQSPRDLKPTVILISIDGMRFDYLAKYKPPVLTALARTGVRARWMTPSYPSLTFPNHYTIATGLYPEDHGIVTNEFYDPIFKTSFSMSKDETVQDGRWWGGEPIWATAEKQGQHAASYFFPGSEAEIAGRRPSYWKHYDGDVPNATRVDGVLSWLDLPVAQRPTFIALYFSDVDHAGHESSPESREVAEAVAEVDRAIGRLVNGLNERGIYDQVNIIVVSDHGMAKLQPLDVVILDEKFHAENADQIAWGRQVTHIFPKAGETRTIYRALSRARVAHATCYRKEAIPARFHYRNNRRIAPIVCMADEGWRIYSRKVFDEERSKDDFPKHPIGAHGYDNQLRSMRATFIAHGPAFRHGVVAPFANVNVYNMMARILKLKPAKNDGNMAVARRVLR